MHLVKFLITSRNKRKNKGKTRLTFAQLLQIPKLYASIHFLSVEILH